MSIQKRPQNIDKKAIKQKPGTTIEARENQLISLAMDVAEKQLRDGTASSQIVSHYIRLGTTKERLEKEILEQQKELMKAKTEAIKSAQRIEALYSEALKAMRSYRGDDEGA